MKYIYSILSLILFTTFQVSAQTFNFYASSVDTAYVNTSFKLTYVFENTESVDNFTPPEMKDFNIVSQMQGYSNSSDFYGNTKSQINVTYILQAKKEGKLTIKEASAEINGKEAKSNSIEIFVKPAKREKIFLNKKEYYLDELVYLKVISDNHSPYIGEPVTLNLKLYTPLNIVQFSPINIPEFNEFWKVREETTQTEPKIETINGLEYHVFDIQKITLVPIKPGKFNLEAYQFQSIIQVPVIKRNFFGELIQVPQNTPSILKSPYFAINVKALPENGKPENFSGAVGNFKLNTQINLNAVDYNEPLNLTANISGIGNFNNIDVPQITLPPEFEVYDPEISEKVEYLKGSKSYSYIVVPNKPGSYKVSPLSFNYFDVKSETYKTLYADSLTLEIGGELPEEIITEVTEDTIPQNELYRIVSTSNLSKNKETFYGSTKYYTALASPIFLFAFLFLAKRIKEKSLIDVVALKRKRASKEAQKRLKKAYLFLKGAQKEAFYTEIFDALNGYVSDKLNISQADLNKELIIEKFKEKNVPEHLANQFNEVLTNAEAALYSPASISKMQEDYDIAIKWIVEIEHEIT